MLPLLPSLLVGDGPSELEDEGRLLITLGLLAEGIAVVSPGVLLDIGEAAIGVSCATARVEEPAVIVDVEVAVSPPASLSHTKRRAGIP